MNYFWQNYFNMCHLILYEFIRLLIMNAFYCEDIRPEIKGKDVYELFNKQISNIWNVTIQVN